MDRGGPGNVPPPGLEQDSGRGGPGRRPSGFDRNAGGASRFGDQGGTSGFGNVGGRPGSGFPGSRFNGRGGANSGLPDGGGFVFDGAPVTRREFAQRIDQTCGWLAAHGIGKIDLLVLNLYPFEAVTARADCTRSRA